jgi:hypothetical protein
MNKYKYILIALTIILVYSCSSDDIEPVVTADCDNIGLSYTDDIAAIFNSSCATTVACHSSNSSSTFSLASYADIELQIPNNRISGSINRSSGFSPMPRGAAQLDDCTISMIDQWLDDGAPE